MNESSQLLFEIIFDPKGADEKAVSLKKTISLLKKEMQATQKEFDSGQITVEEYEASMTAITPQLRKATEEQRKNNQAISDYEKATKVAKGSLDQMRAQIGIVTQHIHGMSEEERKSAEGTELIEKVQRLNKEYDEQRKKLTEGKKSLVDYIGELEPFGVNIGKTYESFKASGRGVANFVKELYTVKGAIAATGIGLLLLAFGALITYLTKTQAGLDYLERKMSGVTAIIQRLTDIVAGVGEKIFKAFEEGKLGATLLDAVLTNLINRYEGLKKAAAGALHFDYSEFRQGTSQAITGVENLSGKVDKLTTDLNNARTAAEKTTGTLQGLRDEEIQLGVAQAKSRAEIEKLKKISEDTEKSAQARLQAANQAYSKENALMERGISLQQRKVAALKEQAKQQQVGSKIGVEASREIAEEEKKLYEQIEQSESRQTEIQNERNQIKKEGIEKGKEATKGAIAEETAMYERALIQARRNREETIDIEEKLIQLRAKSAMVDAKTAGQRKLITAQAEADIFQLRVDNEIKLKARQLNIEEAHLVQYLALVKEGSGRELMLRVALIENEGNKLREQARASIADKTERDATIRAIDAQTKRKLLDAEREFIVKQIQLQQEKAERLLNVQRTLLERFNKDQRAQISVDQADAATRLAKSKENSKEELAAKIDVIEASRATALQSAREELGTDIGNAKVLAATITAINAEADRAIADNHKQFNLKTLETITNIAQQLGSAISRVADAQAQAELNNLQRQEDAKLNSAGLSAEMRGKIEEEYAQKQIELQQDLARRKQKIASKENIINTSLAIVRALVDPGGILGAVYAALALGAGIAQQSVIDSTTFAKGGIIDGPSHVQGGVKYVIKGQRVELEGKEGVINKRSMAIPGVREQASYLNQLGGGVAFPGTSRLPTSTYKPARLEWGTLSGTGRGTTTGYRHQRMEFGGIIGRAIQQNQAGGSVNAIIDHDTLARTVSGLVVDSIKALPPSVVYVESIHSKSSEVIRVASNADAGI